MAKVALMIGRGGVNGAASASPVWQGLPRIGVAVTSSATSATLSGAEAYRGEVVRFKTAGGAVWIAESGAAAANKGLFLADGDIYEAQYLEGHTAGWRVIDA